MRLMPPKRINATSTASTMPQTRLIVPVEEAAEGTKATIAPLREPTIDLAWAPLPMPKAARAAKMQ